MSAKNILRRNVSINVSIAMFVLYVNHEYSGTYYNILRDFLNASLTAPQILIYCATANNDTL